MPAITQGWEDMPWADRPRHEMELIIWWRETGNKHTNKQMGNKSIKSMIISDNEWARVGNGQGDRPAQRVVGLIGHGEAGGFYSTGKGEWLEGVKQRRDMMQFIKKVLLLALCRMGFGGVKGKDKVGRPVEGNDVVQGRDNGGGDVGRRVEWGWVLELAITPLGL